jgi:hypothetical protein
VKGLIALHGGEFDIKSRLGGGTRVTVRLPLECRVTMRVDKPAVVEHLTPHVGAPEPLREFEKVKRSA